METERRAPLLTTAVLFGLVLFAPLLAAAQGPPPAGACQMSPAPTPAAQKPEAAQASPTPAAPTPAPAGGIRIQLRDENNKPVAGKRLFLVKRSAFASGLDWANAPRRSAHLQGASQKLLDLLNKYGCDSLYCPEIEAELPEAVKSVEEFRLAYEAGLKKYGGNEKLALRWLTVNLPPRLNSARSGYFRQKRAWLSEAAKRTAAVASLMTDERGWAVFPGYQKAPGEGDYYVSNLLPFREGGPVWDCKVTTLPPNPRQLFSVTYTLTPPPAKPAAASP